MGDESHTAKLRSGLEGGFVHAVATKDMQTAATEASVSVSIAPYAPCRLLQGPPMRRGVLQCLQDPPGRVHPAEQAP